MPDNPEMGVKIFGDPFIVPHEEHIFGVWFWGSQNQKSTWHLYDHSEFRVRLSYAWGVSKIKHVYEIFMNFHAGCCGNGTIKTLHLRKGWDRAWDPRFAKKRHICPKCAKILFNRLKEQGLLVKKGYHWYCIETLDRWFKDNKPIDMGEKAWYDV